MTVKRAVWSSFWLTHNERRKCNRWNKLWVSGPIKIIGFARVLRKNIHLQRGHCSPMACGCRTSSTSTWRFRFFFSEMSRVSTALWDEMVYYLICFEKCSVSCGPVKLRIWYKDWSIKMLKEIKINAISARNFVKRKHSSLLSSTPPPPSHSSSWQGVCQQWGWEEDDGFEATLIKPLPPFPKPATQMVVLFKR